MSARTLKKRNPQDARRADLEVQIHPSDIRKPVKYLFLGRRHLLTWGTGMALYLAFLGWSATLAPRVLVSLWRAPEYRAMEQTRLRLGERLVGVQERFKGLVAEAETLRLRVDKIYLAYGLTNDTSIGQGGYPITPRQVPDSIYEEQLAGTARFEAELSERVRVLDAFLGEIRSFERAKREQLLWTPSISPLASDEFVLTSPFGTRRSPFTKRMDFHAGIDLSAPIGTPVYAPADGRVNFAGRYPLRQSVSWWRYGNLISIAHGDQFVTLYGHCDEVKVRKGQRVRQGDLIGTVGNTGWSTNPHLHFEVRRLDEDGKLRPVDPRIYMLDRNWRDEEELLVRARKAPKAQQYEPLPRSIR